jgi:hypothetical protein
MPTAASSRTSTTDPTRTPVSPTVGETSNTRLLSTPPQGDRPRAERVNDRTFREPQRSREYAPAGGHGFD